MSGSHHGPKGPTGSFRTLPRSRNLRGILDRRRFQEADLRTAEVRGAFGKGFHVVSEAGNPDVTYIVKDQTGGRTFAPGSTVLLGSVTGMPGEVVLGGPPPGREGGARSGGRVRRPGHRKTITPPVETPDQYAFHDDGSTLRAWLYLGGAYDSDRGSIASYSGVQAEPYACILVDANGQVGNGSVLLADTTNGYATYAVVWDVENATAYEYTAPTDTSFSLPLYHGGYLWWVEGEDYSTHGDREFITVQFCRSDCNFENRTVLATWTSPACPSYAYPTGGFVYWEARAYGAVVTETGLVAWVKLRSEDNPVNSESFYHYLFKINYDGTGLDPSDGGAENSTSADHPMVGEASGSGAAVGGKNFNDGSGDQVAVWRKLDDNTNDPAAFWPFVFGGDDSCFLRGFNVSPSGESVQIGVYNGTSGEVTFYRDSAVTTPILAAPVVTVTPAAHPTVGEKPTWMFYFGGS